MRKQIAIDELTHKELIKFADKHKVSNGKAVKMMLEYFKKSGANPEERETPASQISKLSERVEQVIKFQRVFEKDKLQPIANDMLQLYGEMKANNLHKKLAVMYEAIEKTDKSQEQIKKGTSIIAEYLADTIETKLADMEEKINSIQNDIDNAKKNKGKFIK